MNDFYSWGNNCRILGFNTQDCVSVLYPENSSVTAAEEDMFMEGYFTGNETAIASLPAGLGVN